MCIIMVYLMLLILLLQSVLDNQEVHKIKEKARLNSIESQVQVCHFGDAERRI